jgi:D-cysteine desulfhydrase
MNGPSSERPLFKAYPRLRTALPHVSLGAFPTPVERLETLEARLGSTGVLLYVKRDDLSGEPYGGNKVRKLEFILGQARQQGCGEVLTFGGAGSNHALATALYARKLGMQSISMLIPQPNAYSVRKNLLMSHHIGVELHQRNRMPTLALATLVRLCIQKLRNGRFPYLIAPGGTSALGMAGFVNAAFELKEQVDRGEMPEPDCIYAALGTMGTVIGLLLGVRAAGLRTRVAAVRVTDPQFSSLRKAKRLFHNANRLLHKADPSFPLLPFPCDAFSLIHDFYGEAYGLYTPESIRAIRLLEETEGLHLEGTYTGKAFAALLSGIETGALQDQTILFWNTHNSLDFDDEISDMDYHGLPECFYPYFEKEVQPLDRHSCG